MWSKGWAVAIIMSWLTLGIACSREPPKEHDVDAMHKSYMKAFKVENRNDSLGYIVAIAWVDDRRVVAGTVDGIIEIWDVTTATRVFRERMDANDGPALCSLPHDQSVFVGGRPNLEIRELAVGPNEVSQRMIFQSDEKSRIISMDCAIRSDVLALSTEGHGDILLVNRSTGEQIAVLRGHRLSPRAVKLTSDGKELLSICNDNTLRKWDIVAQREVWQWQGHHGRPASLAVSADGNAVATGDTGHVRVFRVHDGQPDTVNQAHEGMVLAIAFSPDGEYLVSCGDIDQTCILWEAKTLVETRRILMQGHRPKSVAFSPDGSFIATGGEDGYMRIWNVQQLLHEEENNNSELK